MRMMTQGENPDFMMLMTQENESGLLDDDDPRGVSPDYGMMMAQDDESGLRDDDDPRG